MSIVKAELSRIAAIRSEIASGSALARERIRSWEGLHPRGLNLGAADIRVMGGGTHVQACGSAVEIVLRRGKVDARATIAALELAWAERLRECDADETALEDVAYIVDAMERLEADRRELVHRIGQLGPRVAHAIRTAPRSL